MLLRVHACRSVAHAQLESIRSIIPLMMEQPTPQLVVWSQHAVLKEFHPCHAMAGIFSSCTPACLSSMV
jgi:hypothetical protein